MGKEKAGTEKDGTGKRKLHIPKVMPCQDPRSASAACLTCGRASAAMHALTAVRPVPATLLVQLFTITKWFYLIL